MLGKWVAQRSEAISLKSNLPGFRFEACECLGFYGACRGEVVSASANRSKGCSVRQSISDRAFERVLAGVRDGKTLNEICGIRGMPSRGAVLKRLADSPESELQMMRARRIGVWAQLDTIAERLASAAPTELGALKELANHVRWLASKLAADSFNTSPTSGRELIEIRWHESDNVAD